jgi:hypothetical protein
MEGCMKKIRDESSPPNGTYWIYIDPDSGQRFEHPFWEELSRLAVRHRKANAYHLGANWSEFFMDNICINTPDPKACIEGGIVDKAKSFAKAMARWAASGFVVVSEDEYNRRMEICKACEYWGGERSLGNVHCKACGCSRLKLYLGSKGSKSCPKMKW